MDAIAKQHEAEETALRTLIPRNGPAKHRGNGRSAPTVRPRATAGLEVRPFDGTRPPLRDWMAEAGGELRTSPPRSRANTRCM